jgi:putative FmdB family regulatory protein
MPTYEYRCERGHLITMKHSVKAILIECPKCDSSVHRVISASPIIFKGEGWTSKDKR